MVVIEAIAEDLAAKPTCSPRLEAVVDADTLLATNTSSLSVTALAQRAPHPERLVGLHFFNPAYRMKLVEVVRGAQSGPAYVELAANLVRCWGKTPVRCDSTPGFIVNRVARPFYGEAQRMVEERVTDPATIDALLREAGGFPLGPFELTDLIGQDVNLAVGRSVWEQTFHDPRYAPTVWQQRARRRRAIRPQDRAGGLRVRRVARSRQRSGRARPGDRGTRPSPGPRRGTWRRGTPSTTTGGT